MVFLKETDPFAETRERPTLSCVFRDGNLVSYVESENFRHDAGASTGWPAVQHPAAMQMKSIKKSDSRFKNYLLSMADAI